MKCAHCGNETTPRTSWSEHSGWSKPRKTGGVNALVARRNTGRVLCQDCGTRLAEGFLRPERIGTQDERQGELL